MPFGFAQIAVKARKSPSRSTRDADNLIAQLLSRIAEILLRLGLDSPRAESLLRRAFVRAALKKIRAGEARPTQSKLASLAGLSRLEVRTILQDRRRVNSREWTRIDHIVTGWKNDPLFLDSRGRPRPLDIRGRGATFERLAKKYGRDVTARTLRDELIRRKIASQKKRQLVLSPDGARSSHDLLAAQSDLKFLVSHLMGIDFQLGRRAYLFRQGAVLAEDRKGVEMVKRIAVERLETVLSSLAEMSVDTDLIAQQSRRRARRLLITAIVATEAEDKSK